MSGSVLEVKLVSATALPIETIGAVWFNSRPSSVGLERFGIPIERYPLTAQDVKELYDEGVINNVEFDKLVQDIMQMDLPCIESVHFTFGFTHMPVDHREQVVRERMWGFWLQSSREFDQSAFADDGEYFVPLRHRGTKSNTRYDEMIQTVQGFYCELQEDHGWKPEEARSILPGSRCHGGSMMATMRTLKRTVEKRSCWIAQLEYWGPLLEAISSGLSKIDDRLKTFISPPCMKGDEFKSCKFERIMQNRCEGKDPYPVCPLYAAKVEGGHEPLALVIPNWEKRETENGNGDMAASMGLRFSKIWNRDPFTGKTQ